MPWQDVSSELYKKSVNDCLQADICTNLFILLSVSSTTTGQIIASMSIDSSVEKYPLASAPIQRSQAETKPTVFTIQVSEEGYGRSNSRISDLSETQKDWSISVVKKLRRETCPNRVGTLAKIREYMLFASSEIWVRSQDGVQQFKALSTNARFSHYVVDPFYRWYGLNDRVVTTAGLGRIGLLDGSGQQDSCVSKSSAKRIVFIEKHCLTFIISDD